MQEHSKKRMTVGVTIAVVATMALAITASYSLFLQSSITGTSGKQPTTGGFPASVHPEGLFSAYLASLKAPSIIQYITTAYRYSSSSSIDIATVVYSSSNYTLSLVPIYVIAAQNVVGNWTTGYTITYTGIKLFNVIVACTGDCDHGTNNNYTATNVNSASLPDSVVSLSFDSQAQRAIQVALSRTIVRDLAPASTYYVDSVTPNQPSPNNMTKGNYLVSLYQINGTHILNVYVAPSLDGVVAIQQVDRQPTY
jgi:hypothetical protein